MANRRLSKANVGSGMDSQRPHTSAFHPTPTNQQPTTTHFTLVELLMVIGIIAILAGLLMVGANELQQRAKRDNIRVLIDRVQTALEQYEADGGDLKAIVGTTEGTTDYERVETVLKKRGAVEQREVAGGRVVDYWGHYLRLRREGENQPALDVWSVGPDATNDTDDDVVNWTRNWQRNP